MRSPLSGSNRRFGAVFLFAALMAWGLVLSSSTAGAGAGKALILSTTVTGGADSLESDAAEALGLTVDLVDGAGWAALSASDFAAYQVIILGDPTCSTNASILDPVAANAGVWGPEVDGNIIIIGSDPVFHQSLDGAKALVEQGIAFAADVAGSTGLYATTSCYYHSSGGAVPAFDGIDGGGFNAVAGAALPSLDDVRIVATHPAMGTLTNADLSGWSNSVHNAFDAYPDTFEVLAVGFDDGAAYTAPDGTPGHQYILARGEGLEVERAVTLAPETAELTVGDEHTVTATVELDDAPVADATIEFEVLTGPHAGETGSAMTDAAGTASFTYTGAAAGTDTIVATWDRGEAGTLESNEVTATWSAPVDTTPETTTTSTTTPGEEPAEAEPARAVRATPTFTG